MADPPKPRPATECRWDLVALGEVDAATLFLELVKSTGLP